MNTLDEIVRYCNEKNNIGALLLTGEWGCGKTHFISNVLKPKIEDNFHVIRISLFGENNPQSIHRKVKREYILKKYKILNNGKIKKTLMAFKRGVTVLTDVFPFLNAVDKTFSPDWLDFINIENPTDADSSTQDKKSFILIFDDFERCSMSSIDLMGCLNEYIENLKIKTIIVADDSKIKEITNEQNDSYFRTIKEKLIAYTIQLHIDHSEIVRAVINSYNSQDKNFKDFLTLSDDIITNEFITYGKNNIRSLIFSIQSFERVYANLARYQFDSDIIKGFLSEFLNMAFKSRVDELKGSDFDTLFVEDIDFSKHPTKRFFVLRPVRHWLLTGDWDQNDLNRVLMKKAKMLETRNPKETLLESNLLDLEEDTLELGFPDAISDAYNGLLSFDECINLLQIIVTARLFEVTLPIEINYESFLDGIKKRISNIKNGSTVEPENHFALGKRDYSLLKSDELLIIKEISDYRHNISHIADKRDLLNALNSNIHETIRELLTTRNIVFDEEISGLIFKYYCNQNNSKKRLFVSYLIDAWKIAHFQRLNEIEDSIKSLGLLQNLLSQNIGPNQIKSIIDKRFIESINEFIEKYKIEKEKIQEKHDENALDNVII